MGSLAQNSWKLIVTPLHSNADAREAVVEADNWLSALRLARKQLGEEGGVPSGASCVMSATGEVTILDAAQRRRYTLARTGDSIPPAKAGPSVAPAKGKSVPPQAVSKSTIAYSPQASAELRAQVPVGSGPRSASSPAFTPVTPRTELPKPLTPAQKPADLASNAEPAKPASGPHAGAQELKPAGAEKAAAKAEPGAAAHAKPASEAPKPFEPARPGAPLRKTVAYSPEESAAVRAQVNAREGAPSAASKSTPSPAGAPPTASSKPATGPVPSKLGDAPARKVTMAYSPEESAAVRAQIVAAQPAASKPAVEAGGSTDARGTAASRTPSANPPAGRTAPASSPITANPAASSPARKVTMAYSPEESAAVRAQIAAASPAPAGEKPPSGPVSKPASGALRTGTAEYSSKEVAEARAALLAAQKAQVALAPTEPPPPANPVAVAAVQAPAASPAAARKVTMAYSPEESAAARAQLAAAQGAKSGAGAAIPVGAPAQPQRRASTVAYMESPITSSGFVVLTSRDEDPSPASPLSYRERAYFAGDHIDRSQLESLLGQELERVRAELEGRPRGQFINLGVFDHMFQGKPQRPPIATLEWKDWRGEPVFTQSTQAEAWSGSGEAPVRSSFVPSSRSSQQLEPVRIPEAAAVPSEAQTLAASAQPASAVEAPSLFEPSPSELPSSNEAPMSSPAPAPSAQAERRAPSAAMYTPPPVQAPSAALATPRGANESWPSVTASAAKRDATGEQDRRLAVAFEAVQDLYFLSSAAEGLDFAVKLLGELVPCEAVSGSVYDINTDEFRFVAATGPGADERRAQPVLSSSGLLSVAMHSGQEAYVVADAGNDPRFDALADGRVGLIPRNMVYLSLHRGELWLGMLQLINRESPRGFSDGDLAVASYLAVQVAEFLQARRQLGGRKRG